MKKSLFPLALMGIATAQPIKERGLMIHIFYSCFRASPNQEVFPSLGPRATCCLRAIGIMNSGMVISYRVKKYIFVVWRRVRRNNKLKMERFFRNLGEKKISLKVPSHANYTRSKKKGQVTDTYTHPAHCLTAVLIPVSQETDWAVTRGSSSFTIDAYPYHTHHPPLLVFSRSLFH